jgi:hypothetical protein
MKLFDLAGNDFDLGAIVIEIENDGIDGLAGTQFDGFESVA